MVSSIHFISFNANYYGSICIATPPEVVFLQWNQIEALNPSNISFANVTPCVM